MDADRKGTETGVIRQRIKLIKNFYEQHMRMPSYAEMALLFGVKSKNAVYKSVRKLIEAGLLEKDETGHIKLTRNPTGIRILGSVEAGFPSPAEEELRDTVSLERFLIDNPESTFMLEVSGDSMINAGILPGDYVLVDKSKKPMLHDIVIAQVDGEWTMKYLERDRSGKYVLTPANPKYSPIKPEEELIIAGVVIGVVRKYR